MTELVVVTDDDEGRLFGLLSFSTTALSLLFLRPSFACPTAEAMPEERELRLESGQGRGERGIEEDEDARGTRESGASIGERAFFFLRAGERRERENQKRLALFSFSLSQPHRQIKNLLFSLLLPCAPFHTIIFLFIFNIRETDTKSTIN